MTISSADQPWPPPPLDFRITAVGHAGYPQTFTPATRTSIRPEPPLPLVGDPQCLPFRTWVNTMLGIARDASPEHRNATLHRLVGALEFFVLHPADIDDAGERDSFTTWLRENGVWSSGAAALLR